MKMKLLFGVFSLIFFVGLCSANESYTCPTRIKITSASVIVEKMPSGFESFSSPDVAFLTGNNVFDGHPKQEAALMPTSSSNDGKVARWDFKGQYPEGKWISCDYMQGYVRLTKKISDSVKSCTAKIRTLSKTEKTLEIQFDCN